MTVLVQLITISITDNVPAIGRRLLELE